jgi:hypothetical protein
MDLLGTRATLHRQGAVEIGFFRDKASSQAAMHELHEKHSIRYENFPSGSPRATPSGRRGGEPLRRGRRSRHQRNIRDISATTNASEALFANEQAARLQGRPPTARRTSSPTLATRSARQRDPRLATILRSKQCSDEEVREDGSHRAQLPRADATINDVLDISSIVSGSCAEPSAVRPRHPDRGGDRDAATGRERSPGRSKPTSTPPSRSRWRRRPSSATWIGCSR